MNEYPCVTVVVNTYERPEMLERALDSVAQQDFEDFEVMVIHDGPASEETIQVCEDFSKAFDADGIAFLFMALQENSGYQCVPKNAAIPHARGDYIAYLDDDNEWTPNHLKDLVEAIEEGEDWPDFVYGIREYVRDKGAPEKVGGTRLWVGKSEFVPWGEQAMKRLADNARYNFIDTSDTLIAKGALWRLHLATEMMWNESLRRFGDWELFTRAVHFAGWRGRGINKVVQRYHWHDKNIQHTRPLNETPQLQPVGHDFHRQHDAPTEAHRWAAPELSHFSHFISGSISGG